MIPHFRLEFSLNRQSPLEWPCRLWGCLRLSVAGGESVFHLGTGRSFVARLNRKVENLAIAFMCGAASVPADRAAIFLEDKFFQKISGR
jgi:hypothetical protein